MWIFPQNGTFYKASKIFTDSVKKPCRPDRAVRRLHCWIKRCKPLYGLLTAGDAAFDRRQIITVREATLIMEYLGAPGEEP